MFVYHVHHTLEDRKTLHLATATENIMPPPPWQALFPRSICFVAWASGTAMSCMVGHHVCLFF